MYLTVPSSFLGISLALKCYVSWEFWFLGDSATIGNRTGSPSEEKKTFQWESLVAFLSSDFLLNSQIEMIVIVKDRIESLCGKDQEL